MDYAAQKVQLSGAKIVMLTGPSASGKTTSAQLGAAACTGREDGLDFLHDIDIIVTFVTRLAPAHVFQILQRILLPVEVIGAVARFSQQMAFFQHGGYVRVVVLLLILDDDELVADGGKRMQRIFNFKYPNEYIQRFAEVLERKKGVAEFYDHDLGTKTTG